MMGLWLLCRLTAEAIVQSGGDVRRLSVATALRRVRKATRAPLKRRGRGGLGRQLAQAVKDSYVRKSGKQARNGAHKKKPKPIGEPRARMAEKLEIEQARELKEKAVAA